MTIKTNHLRSEYISTTTYFVWLLKGNFYHRLPIPLRSLSNICNHISRPSRPTGLRIFPQTNTSLYEPSLHDRQPLIPDTWYDWNPPKLHRSTHRSTNTYLHIWVGIYRTSKSHLHQHLRHQPRHPRRPSLLTNEHTKSTTWSRHHS